jgi:hypothetical protein
MIMAEKRRAKDFWKETTEKTTETTQTGENFQTTNIWIGSVDQTTPLRWLTRRIFFFKIQEI